MSDGPCSGGGVSRIKNRREVFGWAMFDFANSSFTTVIVTTLFAIHFREHVAEGQNSLWGVAIAVSQILVVLSAPFIGALADFSGSKKLLLFGSYVGCVAMTAALGLVPMSALVATMCLFVLANFCFSSGENLVAGFLPEISATENVGKVSGLGWALGYFGGIGSILLAGRLSADLQPADANRVVCLTTAVFFLFAGIPTFLLVRERKIRETMPPGSTYLTIGFRRVAATWRRIRDFSQLLRFLTLFLVFNTGVTTVVAFSFIYAKTEFGFTDQDMETLFVAINVAAAGGAFACGYLQDRFGSRSVLQAVLALWTTVVVIAALAGTKGAFWVAGIGVGVCIGSTQAASRALVARFSPTARAGEFLGFWGSFGKLSAVVGPLLFGVLSDAVSMRTAVAMTVIWFLLGFVGMFFIDEAKGIEEARAADEQGA
jgi:MFS transporter, UMF1 family